MKNKNLLIGIVLLVVIFNSIVYSALNSEMFINGDAHIRVEKDIRITDVVVLEQVNGSYETYNSDYSKNTTSMQVTLPSSESIMIYEVTITNKGDIDYEVNSIVEESYSNNNIRYELIDIEDGVVIDGGTTKTFKIKFTTTENNTDNKTTLVLKYTFKEWIPTLYNMVAHKSRGLDTGIDFGVAPTKETSGIYKMNSTKDDNNPVYYYRGIIDNNNVSFAGFCWKIVRTTETGGVKLIYNGIPGSDGSCNNTGVASQIGTSQFNSNSTSMEDVSYVYDNGNDSEIKKVIDKWYSDNMLGYTNMLEDTIWCNDRSIGSISNGITFFGPNARLMIMPYKPDIMCKEEKDRFTVNDSNGNGKLTYPVALLTTDELALSDNIWSENSGLSYLLTNEWWWLLSPHFHSHGNSYGGRVSGNSKTPIDDVRSNIGVRPSISLVSGTMVKEGNGSISNPYKLVEDKITKEWAFDYTGKEQELIVPYDGVYKLETWGAQGGYGFWSPSFYKYGGYGGYSSGEISLKKGDVLYINVGDKGGQYSGGYNGGGNGLYSRATEYSGGGGGATHISLVSGVLSTLSSKLDSLLIVSGGGGGGSTCSYQEGGTKGCTLINSGGVGGGYLGNSNILLSNKGGSQNLGGSVNSGYYGNEGSFGQGGHGYRIGLPDCNGLCESQGGGGGGLYGGASNNYSGSGGSGYIANPHLSNKVMYCYECQESSEESIKTISTANVSEEAISNYAKKGAGYAKIILISKK